MEKLAMALLALYGGVALLLSLYALHRLVLTWLFVRARRAPRAHPTDLGAEPMVTVQLPVFNEPYVVERLIDAVVAMDWPRTKLEIQVLDDSTDETTGLAFAAVARWRARGVDIALLHRSERHGFKAGALAEGLRVAKGSFIAIFDADFVPPRDFLSRAMAAFAPGVGMVQARWGHINAREGWLMRVQAMLLDGHFVIEHAARASAGLWFNFNGTAGIWRREAIESAGGWQHDTLTEDLDLSYRAQLAGWRFVYLSDLVVPGELPPDLAALRAQQHRWAKGSIQTARKLLTRVWRAPVELRVKLEATSHLCANLSYPFAIALAMLTPVTVAARTELDASWFWFDLVFWGASLGSVVTFYTISQISAWPDGGRRLLALPATLAVGVGLAVGQTRAVVEALLGRASPFVRTPKVGDQRTIALRRIGAAGPGRGLALVEYALAMYQAVGLGWTLGQGHLSTAPLQVIMLAGTTIFAVGGLSAGSGARRISSAELGQSLEGPGDLQGPRASHTLGG